MSSKCKVKLTHMINDSEIIVYETWIETTSLDDARTEALNRFQSAIVKLSNYQKLNAVKVKIEQDCSDNKY